MAKKRTKAELNAAEMRFLTENELTSEELKVIRKLNGASSVPDSELSPRTIEAILQGRRSNPKVLQQAIHNALNEHKKNGDILAGLVSKLHQ